MTNAFAVSNARFAPLPLFAIVIFFAISFTSRTGRADGTAPADDQRLGDDDREIAPNLYSKGNLRIAVACAENRLVEPSQGLRVTIDDAATPLTPLRTNALSSLALDSNDAPVYLAMVTDIGFLAPPGTHRVRIEAPDCAPDEREIEISATHAIRIDGRLAVAKKILSGPVGAPDGLGLGLGAFTSTFPDSLRTGVKNGTSFTIGDATTDGVILSTTIEHRYFALGVDTALGFGSLSGTLTPTSSTSTYDFTASHMMLSGALRLGARLPLEYVAILAGSGVGASLWMTTSGSVDEPSNTAAAFPPTGADFLWDVPLWAAIEIKPFCSWGVEVGGSYNVEPTNFDGNTVMLNASLLWQPSSSCCEGSGVTVSP